MVELSFGSFQVILCETTARAVLRASGDHVMANLVTGFCDSWEIS